MQSPLRYLLSGGALGAGLALGTFLVAAGAPYLAGDDWRSFVLANSTSQHAKLALLVGGLLGAWSVSVEQRRRRRIALRCVLFAALFGPVAGGLFGQGVIVHLLSSVVLAPLYVPLTLGAALLLEWLIRPPPPLADPSPRAKPWRLAIAWALAVGVLATSAVLLPAPIPPRTKLERLMLQVQAQRCDAPPDAAGLSSFSWTRFSDECQAEAARQLGELGGAASDAVPLLGQLVMQLRDVDTGDGVVPVQASIARALAQIGDPAAVADLEIAARMSDAAGAPVARAAIAEALGNLRARRTP